jgi:hypothetical protein
VVENPDGKKEVAVPQGVWITLDCMLCGNSGNLVSLGAVKGIGLDCYTVTCDWCGNEFDTCATEDEAVMAWNWNNIGFILKSERPILVASSEADMLPLFAHSLGLEVNELAQVNESHLSDVGKKTLLLLENYYYNQPVTDEVGKWITAGGKSIRIPNHIVRGHGKPK